MARDESVGGFVVAPTPPVKYDPQSEAAWRRAVSGAFDYFRNSAQAPRLSSVDLFFDASTDQVTLRAVGGTQHRSARFEIADNDSFTGAEVNEVVNMGPGDVVSRSTSSLSGSDRGKVWYGRVTPYSGANGTGQAGTPMEDSDYVPLNDIFGYVRETFSETASEATLTLIPFEDAVFDSVKMASQVGNADMGAFATVAADGSGNYVTTVDLVEKHPSKIAYQVILDGEVVQENVVTFDLGSIANVVGWSVSPDGDGDATVKVNFDSDTETGAGNGEYSTNSGSSWTAFEVLDDRTGSFTIAQDDASEEEVWVRGLNSAGTAGPYRVILIPPFAGAAPPVLTAASAHRAEDGSCSGSTLVLAAGISVEYAVSNPDDDYSIRIRVSEDGGSWSTLVSGLSTSADDYFYEPDNTRVYDFSGAIYHTYAYRVQLRDSGGTVVDERTTNTLEMYFLTCGGP